MPTFNFDYFSRLLDEDLYIGKCVFVHKSVNALRIFRILRRNSTAIMPDSNLYEKNMAQANIFSSVDILVAHLALNAAAATLASHPQRCTMILQLDKWNSHELIVNVNRCKK